MVKAGALVVILGNLGWSARLAGDQMGEQCLWPPRDRTDMEMELGILAPPHPQKPLKGF